MKTKFKLEDVPFQQIYYSASQVTNSIHPSQFVVGLRVAVLNYDELSNFTDKDITDKACFYTGVVESIWGNPSDPIVTIKFDDKPNAISISFGIKQYARFIIKEPKPHERIRTETIEVREIKYF
jgi:hypothetical protein